MPSKRGFAAMTPEQRSAISQKGGRAAHQAGTAHEFTSQEAREAGRLGGKATHVKRRTKLTVGEAIEERRELEAAGDR
jgi:uncharacterized protein